MERLVQLFHENMFWKQLKSSFLLLWNIVIVRKVAHTTTDIKPSPHRLKATANLPLTSHGVASGPWWGSTFIFYWWVHIKSAQFMSRRIVFLNRNSGRATEVKLCSLLPLTLSPLIKKIAVGDSGDNFVNDVWSRLESNLFFHSCTRSTLWNGGRTFFYQLKQATGTMRHNGHRHF